MSGSGRRWARPALTTVRVAAPPHPSGFLGVLHVEGDVMRALGILLSCVSHNRTFVSAFLFR